MKLYRMWLYLDGIRQNGEQITTLQRWGKKKKKDLTVRNEWSQIEILTHIFLKDVLLCRTFIWLLGAGVCGCAHPAGLHIEGQMFGQPSLQRHRQCVF